MKTLNKIILSGLSARLMSCSNESTSPDITGATTEPNSSKTANLTEEQKADIMRRLDEVDEFTAFPPDYSPGYKK